MRNIKDPKLGNVKISEVDKGTGQQHMFGFQWGLYFWQLPDGHLLHDGQGNMLNIPSVKGDVAQQAKIQRAAAEFGFPEGKPYFRAGAARATDEEHEEQVDRLKAGLIPSMNDLGAVLAAKKSLQQFGGEANEG